MAPDQIVSTNPAGFWRTGKYNGRWVMVNPDGNVTILHGINGVAPNSLKEARSDRGEEEYRKRFSNIGEWAGETDRILSDTGFDFYSVNLSRLNMYSTYYPEVQPVMRGEQGESRRGQVEIAFLLRTFKNDYGALTGVNFSESDASIFTLLFDPGYLDYIDNLAEQATAPFRGDRAFIGYYTDNELQFRWASSSTPAIYLKHWIALDTSDGKPRAYAYARQYAENFMREKYGKEPLASNITSAMEEAFLLDVSSYYYKTVSETLRRHDPDHLILGSRLHGMPITLQTIHKACAEYCDVVSLNIYSVWEPDDSFFINQFKVWVPAKPCIVTEFYTRDAETSYGGEKYANTGEGGGWIVASQASRGLYYQNFTRKLISYDHCVGWQWFQFSDDYRVGYGWNNKGIVNPAYEPYVDCTSFMQQLHWNIYQIMDYYHSPTGNRESGGTLAMEILR